MKLYFGNTTAAVTTIMIVALIGFIGYSIWNRTSINSWGRRSLVCTGVWSGRMLLCSSKDGLDKTIQHMIDGSCAPGLFPLVSVLISLDALEQPLSFLQP